MRPSTAGDLCYDRYKIQHCYHRETLWDTRECRLIKELMKSISQIKENVTKDQKDQIQNFWDEIFNQWNKNMIESFNSKTDQMETSRSELINGQEPPAKIQ